MPGKKTGLYSKYRITKVDGSPVDPKAIYFVLRLDTDAAARQAARQYALETPDRELALALTKVCHKIRMKEETRRIRREEKARRSE